MSGNISLMLNMISRNILDQMPIDVQNKYSYNMRNIIQKFNNNVINNDELIDKIFKHVVNVVNLSSSSGASKTDLWILTLKNACISKTNIVKSGSAPIVKSYCCNVDNAFMKISLNPNISNSINNQSYNYEINVYKRIKDMIDKGICNNYVRPLAWSHKCSYSDLYKMLLKSYFLNKQNYPELTEDSAPENLRVNLNNIILFMDNSLRNRSQLNKINNMFSINNSIFENITKNNLFNVIINEYITPNTSPHVLNIGESIKFEEWMTDIYMTNPVLYKQHLLTIILQITLASKILGLCNITHNDLHLGNIYITKCNKEQFYYNINNNVCSFESEYHVKIYDFDRSYCSDLGNNQILNDGSMDCNNYSRCNKLILNKDVIKVFCLISDTVPDMKEYLTKILILENLADRIDDENPQKKLIDGVFNLHKRTIAPVCNLQKYDVDKMECVSISDESYNNINTIDKIIINLCEYIRIDGVGTIIKLYLDNDQIIRNTQNIRFYTRNMNIFFENISDQRISILGRMARLINIYDDVTENNKPEILQCDNIKYEQIPEIIQFRNKLYSLDDLINYYSDLGFKKTILQYINNTSETIYPEIRTLDVINPEFLETYPKEIQQILTTQTGGNFVKRYKYYKDTIHF